MPGRPRAAPADARRAQPRAGRQRRDQAGQRRSCRRRSPSRRCSPGCGWLFPSWRCRRSWRWCVITFFDGDEAERVGERLRRGRGAAAVAARADRPGGARAADRRRSSRRRSTRSGASARRSRPPSCRSTRSAARSTAWCGRSRARRAAPRRCGTTSRPRTRTASAPGSRSSSAAATRRSRPSRPLCASRSRPSTRSRPAPALLHPDGAHGRLAGHDARAAPAHDDGLAVRRRERARRRSARAARGGQRAGRGHERGLRAGGGGRGSPARRGSRPFGRVPSAAVRIFSGIQPTGSQAPRATTSARSSSTSRGRTAATRRSTASSTCTRSRSPTTRPSCASASTTLLALLLAAGLDPDALHPLPPGRRRTSTPS